MFKLSIHTLIVSSLLLSASAFAVEEIGDRPENEMERVQRESAMKAFHDPTQKTTVDDLSDIARRYNRSWKTSATKNEKVTVTKPILESSFLDAKSFNKGLVADLENTSPEHIKAIEAMYGGLKVEIPADINSKDPKLKAAAQLVVDAQRISARNTIAFLDLFSPEEVSKDFDAAKTRAESKIYKVQATKSLVGFEHFAILAKIDAIINKQQMNPAEAMEIGIEKWLIHLKHNPADVKAEAKKYMECTPVAVGA